jgi:hypothetical protein
MRAPFGLLFPVLAVFAVALAVWAGPDYAIAGPATVAAVGAAALTFLDVVLRAGSRPSLAPVYRVRRVPGVGDLFLAGGAGRGQIVGMLDRLDREGDHPERPLPTPQELARIGWMSDPEFLGYVRERLDALEGNV